MTALDDTPRRLRVEGTLPLDADDQTQLSDYIAHFRDSGMSGAQAFETACLQVAQDLLGGMGFTVEEIEPL